MNENRKATIGLACGILSVLSLAAVVSAIPAGGFWDRHTGIWFLLTLTAFFGGLAGAFLGALGWIDVRRGISTRGLRQAQFGSILGGAVALAMLAAFTILVVGFMIIFGQDGGGGFKTLD